MNRKQCLDAAANCVCKSREQEYTSPENSFAIIAKYWTAYKGVPFDAHDVGMMMALLKVARIQTKRGKDDSYIDLAGYAACACEIAQSEQKQNESIIPQIPTIKKACIHYIKGADGRDFCTKRGSHVLNNSVCDRKGNNDGCWLYTKSWQTKDESTANDVSQKEAEPWHPVWVSVKDAVPVAHERVLVRYHGPKGISFGIDTFFWLKPEKNATHWMILPPLPFKGAIAEPHRWINSTEALPQDDAYVLVHNFRLVNVHCGLGEYVKRYEGYWMPIPTPQEVM